MKGSDFDFAAEVILDVIRLFVSSYAQLIELSPSPGVQGDFLDFFAGLNQSMADSEKGGGVLFWGSMFLLDLFLDAKLDGLSNLIDFRTVVSVLSARGVVDSDGFNGSVLLLQTLALKSAPLGLARSLASSLWAVILEKGVELLEAPHDEEERRLSDVIVHVTLSVLQSSDASMSCDPDPADIDPSDVGELPLGTVYRTPLMTIDPTVPKLPERLVRSQTLAALFGLSWLPLVSLSSRNPRLLSSILSKVLERIRIDDCPIVRLWVVSVCAAAKPDFLAKVFGELPNAAAVVVAPVSLARCPQSAAHLELVGLTQSVIRQLFATRKPVMCLLFLEEVRKYWMKYSPDDVISLFSLLRILCIENSHNLCEVLSKSTMLHDFLEMELVFKWQILEKKGDVEKLMKVRGMFLSLLIDLAQNPGCCTFFF
jgi:hypothetical protein